MNLDFFIPGSSIETFGGGKREGSRKDIKTKNVQKTIDSLKGLLHHEEFKKLNSVFEFQINGELIRTSKNNFSSV